MASNTLAHRGIVALSFAAVLLLFAGTALAATGALTQPSGAGGCVSDTGLGPCADGHGLAGANVVAVSPDGENVYVASYNNNGVARLNRNTTTGALTQPSGPAGCISQIGAGPCADGHALSGVQSVAVSPDGGNVYAATYSNAVVRLNRNTTTGALTQPAGAAGCISQTGVGPCADGHGLKSPVSVMVSSDGKSVYVASPGGDDVARFNRNTTTGALSQPAGTAGCVSETGAGPCADGHALSSPVDLTGSPDGKSVYVASTPSNAAVRLDRNTTTGALTEPSGTDGCISQTGAGGCVMAPQLSQFGSPILNPGFTSPSSVASSADGKSVYVASDSGGVARLNRNTTTGAVTQPANAAGCILQDAASNGIPCADAHGLRNPASAAVSPDGKNVYVTSAGSDGVARLNRNTTTGALTQPAGTGGCTNETGSNDCADGHALRDPTSVAVSADGKSVYLASFLSDAVARFNRTP